MQLKATGTHSLALTSTLFFLVALLLLVRPAAADLIDAQTAYVKGDFKTLKWNLTPLNDRMTHFAANQPWHGTLLTF